jgi:AcrR family transcriptional regulator
MMDSVDALEVDSRAELRARLRAVALDLLQAQGPAALRVRDIAERAGCSTMGVYSCFGSKDGLIEDLFKLGFDRLEHDLESVTTPGSTPESRVVRLTLTFRQFGLSNPALYSLMFERAASAFTPSTLVRLESLVVFRILVEAMHDLPRLAIEPERAAYMLFAAAHGLVSLELTHIRWGGPVMSHLQQSGPEEAYTAAIDALIRGLQR